MIIHCGNSILFYYLYEYILHFKARAVAVVMRGLYNNVGCVMMARNVLKINVFLEVHSTPEEQPFHKAMCKSLIYQGQL